MSCVLALPELFQLVLHITEEIHILSLIMQSLTMLAVHEVIVCLLGVEEKHCHTVLVEGEVCFVLQGWQLTQKTRQWRLLILFFLLFRVRLFTTNIYNSPVFHPVSGFPWSPLCFPPAFIPNPSSISGLDKRELKRKQ